ncbi:hypothetical protein GE061_004406 [Apolygus lucorum]|uniref:Uncharacterized protein n=1 Tax=Apolygus lucorum TaxID=248454 RepID=A0A8S9WYL3_APOLU|nr:hypothetical protein GE061_004406 [Apolygus lucorum]
MSPSARRHQADVGFLLRWVRGSVDAPALLAEIRFLVPRLGTREVGRLTKTDNEKELEEVNGVLRLCDGILAKHPYDWSVSPYAEQFVTSLMKKPLVKSLPLPSVPAPYELENGLEEGSPTRAESDTCLLGLLIDGIVAEGCETLERDPHARGYTLLHQGIYFTIKSHLKLEEVTAQEEIRRICARMLGENRQIRRMGFPSTLQDLFVEQVAVCGVNKFSEFLTDGTVRMIQSLQTSRGCFSMIEKGSRLSIECYNHLSSVAAAAIATFLSA